MRVADYIAKRIAEAGGDCVFMLAGGMAMHLNDAVGLIPGMRYYCNHHEQASAMAADAYARSTGKLGVAMATSGPGATNLLTGLVGAYQDSVPVIFLTGQCKRIETIRGRGLFGLRQCGFLEVDIIPIVQSVTKYAAFVESPERARYHIEKAIYLATHGRPGPVLLDVPLDVQGAPFDESTAEPFVPSEDLHAKPSAAELDDLFARIRAARRPLILAGHGFRAIEQVDAFRTFVHKLGIPVGTSLMAKDLMEAADPLFVGHCGPRGQRGANFAVQSADLVLIMGCSLNCQTVGYEGDLFASNAHKIHIDIDKPVLERQNIGVSTQYQWDIRDYLPEFSKRAEGSIPNIDPKWTAVCATWKAQYGSLQEPHDYGPTDGPANLYETVDVLCNALKGDEIILTDAGQPHPILGQSFRIKGKQRYINPGSLAEMGYAIPAAFGPAAAYPDSNVVVVLGDGSFQTNVQELQTLAHNRFKVKIFVINNGGYGSIRRTQQTFFKSHFVGATPGSGVTMADIEKVCTAFDIPFVRCNTRADLKTTIAEVLAAEGPVVCEVMSHYDQKILPGVPSFMQADGMMRSKALHEMAPDVGVTFEQALEDAGIKL